jgi:hypothetical protein
MKLLAVWMLAIALSLCQQVLAININLVSSPAEAAIKRVIWIRCSLQPGELALFQKGLAVHTDNPAVRIASWQVDAIPALLPPQVFNRVRRAYTETVFFALTLQSLLPEIALREALCTTKFYVSGLALERSLSQRWLIRPVLAVGCMIQNRFDDGIAELQSLSSRSEEVFRTVPTVLWHETKPLNEEFTWLDAFVHVWEQLVLLGVWLNNIYLLLFFFYLMMGCFLKRYTPLRCALVPGRGLTLQWLQVFSVAGFCTLSLCQAIPWLGLPLGCVLIALFFLIGEGYAFIFQPTEKLLLGRMTALLGWLMGVCVLPCLIKGILAWYGW